MQKLCLQNHCHSVHSPCTVITQTVSRLTVLKLWLHSKLLQVIWTTVCKSQVPPLITQSLQSWHYSGQEFSPYRADAYLLNPPPRGWTGQGWARGANCSFVKGTQTVQHQTPTCFLAETQIYIYIFIYYLMHSYPPISWRIYALFVLPIQQPTKGSIYSSTLEQSLLISRCTEASSFQQNPDGGHMTWISIATSAMEATKFSISLLECTLPS